MKTSNIRNLAAFFEVPNISASTGKSSKIPRYDIFDKNYNILYYRILEKVFIWRKRLIAQYTNLMDLRVKINFQPYNQESIVEFNKLLRSFTDSLIDFTNFCETNKNIAIIIPSEPLFEDSCCLKDFSKIIKKQHYRYKDKHFDKSKRRARNQKMAEREFWFSQWIAECEDEESEEVCVSSYLEYLNYLDARTDLIEAEKAIKSPIIYEALWAIHDGIKNEDILQEANTIFQNYIDAVTKYNECIGANS